MFHNRMPKIILSPGSQSSIIRYLQLYRNYFTELYTDTGIFSEDQILQYYEEQATQREREILKCIQEKLTPIHVFGKTPQNSILVHWRSKVIIISWTDLGDIRTVESVIIR
jgi:hypothetical protein